MLPERTCGCPHKSFSHTRTHTSEVFPTHILTRIAAQFVDANISTLNGYQPVGKKKGGFYFIFFSPQNKLLDIKTFDLIIEDLQKRVDIEAMEIK